MTSSRFHTIFVILCMSLFACSDGGIHAYLTPPTVTILSPDDGQVFIEGASVTLTGQAEVAGGSLRTDLVVSWSSSRDGSLFSGTLPEGETTFQRETTELSVGEHTLTFRANANDQDVEDSRTITVVENFPPVIAITSPSSGSVFASNELVPLTALVSDENEETEVEDLRVSWSSSLDGDLALDVVPESSGLANTSSTLSLGEHTLTARVVDPEGKSASAQVAVSVLPPNALPICAILSPDDGEGFAIPDGDTQVVFTVSASATDPDGNATDIEVTLSSDVGSHGVTSPLANGSVSFGNVVLPSGVHTLVLEAQDVRGGTCVTSAVVDVSTRPETLVTAPTPGSVFTLGSPVAFSATASDVEDAFADLIVSWENVTTGQFLSNQPVVGGVTTFTTSNLPAGANDVRVTITDSSGLSAFSATTVVVNESPSVSILSPSASLFTEGETVLFQLQASDPETADPSLLLVNLVSSVDGVLVVGASPNASGTYTWATSALSAATHMVTATVTDPDGAQGTDAVIFTVNAPPVVTILSPSDGEAFASGAPVNFEAVVSDIEDEASGLMTVLGVVWESDLDGVLNADPPSFDGFDWVLAFDSLSLPTPLTEAEHTLTLTVTDADGASFASTVSFALNEAPTAPGIVLSPANPFTGDDLLVTVATVSTDPEGGAILYDYLWTRDGTPAQSTLLTSALSDVVPASVTSHLEVWEVTVWAVDDTGNATPSLPASIMIGNTPPGGTAPDLIPNEAYETTTLECFGVGIAPDVDGDLVSVSYAWTVNGSVIAASGITLDGADFDKEDEVFCAAVLDDGYDTMTLLSLPPVMIENTLPTTPSVVILPSSPSAGDDLVCTISTAATDPDPVDLPLAYEYAWTVNGVPTGHLTNTVPSSDTASGETWTCAARAFDGDGFSSWSPESSPEFVQCNWSLPVNFAYVACSGAVFCNLWEFVLEDSSATGFADSVGASCLLDGQGYSSCVQFDLGSVRTDVLVHIVARSNASSLVCGDTCSSSGCSPASDYHIFRSVSSFFATSAYISSHTVPEGTYQDDVVTIPGSTRYVLFCRGDDGSDANNLELDLFEFCN